MMFACALALLASAYQGPDRGTAFGIWGATTGAAVAVGPLAGGVLTEAIGWEAIFFVNIPIGLGVIALTQRTVEESKAPTGRPHRRAGRRHLLPLAVHARVRPHPLQRGGLGERDDRRAARRLRPC